MLMLLLVIQITLVLRLSEIAEATSLLVRYLWSFVLSVLKMCLEVWCSPADSEGNMLHWVSSRLRYCQFLNWLCNTSVCWSFHHLHRRQVVVLCMLYKIWSNTMYHIFVLLTLSYMCRGELQVAPGCSSAPVRTSSMQHLTVTYIFYTPCTQHF